MNYHTIAQEFYAFRDSADGLISNGTLSNEVILAAVASTDPHKLQTSTIQSTWTKPFSR